MKQKIYQVDAFTDALFCGNPAAVCPLDRWPDDGTLQNIAMENNLAETAFYARQDGHYLIRWFTPTVEVDLCGHATLAAAYVLFNHEHHGADIVRFQTLKSGPLTVTKEGDLLTLNFPADVPTPVASPAEFAGCFDVAPRAAFRGKTDVMLVFDHEDEVKNAVADFEKISKIPARGVIITAGGREVDFVSRFFAPRAGINEDPVTGSAHTTLAPYWSGVLGKTEMTAAQLSKRGGFLTCRLAGGRVEIGGRARLYLTGEIYLPPAGGEASSSAG